MNLGLTGTLNGGKGTVAKILKEYGFETKGFGDEVRKEATLRGIPHRREDLQRLGARLRVEQGVDVWCMRIQAQMLSGANYGIDGIRYLEDDDFFREMGDFKLISVDAPIKRRYDWSVARGYERDASRTFEQFKLDNDNDLGLNGLDCGQNVSACMEIADYHIWNGGDKNQLRMAVEGILEKLNCRRANSIK